MRLMLNVSIIIADAADALFFLLTTGYFTFAFCLFPILESLIKLRVAARQ